MPFTTNRYLNVPNTGDLPGAWGTTAINTNMNSIDGSLGGVTSIALSAATTITLTVGTSAVFTPGPGPSQSEAAVIRLSGTLSGGAVIKFTMPGFYIIDNQCPPSTAFSLRLSPASGGGNVIGAPPGKSWVFFDGTSMDYVNAGVTGSALDLHQSGTALPLWMSVCSVQPYLIKDGSVYNVSSYTALGAMLGSTFGGNGITTFGVPDERARARIAIDTGSTGRLTGSGITATQMNSAGGTATIVLTQVNMPNYSLTVTDPGHTHTSNAASRQGGALTGGPINTPSSNTATISSATTGITVASGGSDTAHGNVQPSIISFLPLVKT